MDFFGFKLPSTNIIWDDIKLKFCFVNGLDKQIFRLLLSEINNLSLADFIDFVLLLCNSPFTVGEAEDITTPEPATSLAHVKSPLAIVLGGLYSQGSGDQGARSQDWRQSRVHSQDCRQPRASNRYGRQFGGPKSSGPGGICS